MGGTLLDQELGSGKSAGLNQPSVTAAEWIASTLSHSKVQEIFQAFNVPVNGHSVQVLVDAMASPEMMAQIKIDLT